MSDLRPIAVAVAVLGLFSGGLAALARFMPLVVEGGTSRLGAAIAATNGLGFLLSPVAVAVVGYGAGSRVDVSEEWARIAAVFGVLGGVAAFVGAVAVTVSVADDLLRTAGVGLFLTLLYTPVGTAVSFALTGLATAAVAQFRGG